MRAINYRPYSNLNFIRPPGEYSNYSLFIIHYSLKLKIHCMNF